MRRPGRSRTGPVRRKSSWRRTPRGKRSRPRPNRERSLRISDRQLGRLLLYHPTIGRQTDSARRARSPGVPSLAGAHGTVLVVPFLLIGVRNAFTVVSPSSAMPKILSAGAMMSPQQRVGGDERVAEDEDPVAGEHLIVRVRDAALGDLVPFHLQDRAFAAAIGRGPDEVDALGRNRGEAVHLARTSRTVSLPVMGNRGRSRRRSRPRR